jgi:hypothetical protein
MRTLYHDVAHPHLSHDTLASSTASTLFPLRANFRFGQNPAKQPINRSAVWSARTTYRDPTSPHACILRMHPASKDFCNLFTTGDTPPNNSHPPFHHPIPILRDEFSATHLLHAQRHTNHRHSLPTLQQRPNARRKLLRHQSLRRRPHRRRK